jgi:hypothetical protein
MSINFCSFLLCCLGFSLSLVAEGCQTKPEGRQSSITTADSATPAAPALDVCRLLSSSEIESIQGVPVLDAQPSIQKQGHLDISQCYYTVHSSEGSKNLSVYIQVVQLNPESERPDALKEFWEEKFGPTSTYESKERKGVVSEKKRIEPPLSVSGIGDEAFWLASARGGALYVLVNDKVVRVSAGGANEAKTMLDNPKALAKKILERLT